MKLIAVKTTLLVIFAAVLFGAIFSELIPDDILDEMRDSHIKRMKTAVVELANPDTIIQKKAALTLNQNYRDHTGIGYHFSADELSKILEVIIKSRNLSVRLAVLSKLGNVALFSDAKKVSSFLKKIKNDSNLEIQNEAEYQLFNAQNDYNDAHTFTIFKQINYFDSSLISTSTLCGHHVIEFYHLNSEPLQRDSKIILPRIYAFVKSHPSDKNIYEACQVLVLLGKADNSVISYLKKFLTHTSPVVRHCAFISLQQLIVRGNVDDRALLRGLIIEGLTSDFWRIRVIAIEWGHPTGILSELPKSLLEKVSNDEVDFVRELYLRLFK